MKLGFFTMPIHPLHRSYAQTLREDREAFILADQLGFSEGFCGEHLTDAAENIPNSMMFLSSLVGATRHITLGTATANLPFSHPAVVATNAAMLDNLLEGRFILGVGAGILRSDAEAVGVLNENRQAMFAEAVDHIIALWTSAPPYKSTGKYWNISTETSLWAELGVGVMVKPYQAPYPRIMSTASDPDSQGMIAMGRRGWLAISSNLLHKNRLKGHWSNYTKGADSVGRVAHPDSWRVARTIFVADDDKVAASYGGDDANSPYRFYMNQLHTKLAMHKRFNTLKCDADMMDEAVTLDYVLNNIVIRGSINKVVDQILELRELGGDFRTLLYCGIDWADPKLGRRSMELMAEKVMPAVNAAIGAETEAAI